MCNQQLCEIDLFTCPDNLFGRKDGLKRAQITEGEWVYEIMCFSDIFSEQYYTFVCPLSKANLKKTRNDFQM